MPVTQAGAPEQLRAAGKDSAVIANITDQEWLAQRTYGTFLVRACPPGADYALTEITARKGIIDLGDKRTLEVPISAREIAEDLCNEINADAGEGSFFGAFVCAGDAPAPEELEAARGRLEAFYRRMVVQADQEWERAHNYTLISDVQRRATRWLGLEKDWAYDPKPMTDCPACGERVKAGVAVCKNCGAVLDREKALAFGLVPAAVDAPVSIESRKAKSENRKSPVP